jgi:hypothetical protein
MNAFIMVRDLEDILILEAERIFPIIKEKACLFFLFVAGFILEFGSINLTLIRSGVLFLCFNLLLLLLTVMFLY